MTEEEIRIEYWDATNTFRELIEQGAMSKEEILEQLEDDLQTRTIERLKVRAKRHIDIESDVLQLQPHGTNSTMFTPCCHVAICDSEGECPRCKKKVYGWNEESAYKCGRARWASATAHWDRRKL